MKEEKRELFISLQAKKGGFSFSERKKVAK